MLKTLELITPPFILILYRKIKYLFKIGQVKKGKDIPEVNSANQFLDIYWDDKMANILEKWGEGSTWREIEYLLVNCRGKVLDIACGTGVCINNLSRYTYLDLYGFDISDKLLEKAIQKGISKKRLRKYDATKTGYNTNEFDYSYSIGSLEHFTEIQIDLFLKESKRYTCIASFHMIPVSENNLNNGWIKKDDQAYFNNSIDWWYNKFKKEFKEVFIFTSAWEDTGYSKGKWFICIK